MTIKWLGHSCFLITTDGGTRILMDPVDPETGYQVGPVECDGVTVSHNHHDHNYLALAQGEPVVMDMPGEYTLGDAAIRGVSTWHDEAQGKKRGPNTVFVVEADGMRLVHCGDLGTMPEGEALAAMGRADILLVPVGGVYTINGQQARLVANALHPKVVIPMHYKTPALTFALEELGPFLSAVKDCSVHYLRQSEAHLSKDSLGSDRVITLEYAK